MQNITLLGATGSIGSSTLDILSNHIDKYRLFAACAHSSVEGLLAICRQWEPRFAVMADERAAERLSVKIRQAGLATQVLAGEAGLSYGGGGRCGCSGFDTYDGGRSSG
jgi:1-deoxy-D-xylulose-5-phosphate reductoisomerase